VNLVTSIRGKMITSGRIKYY